MRITQPVRPRDMWPPKHLAFLLAACLMVALVAIPTYRFSDRNYREDEINTLHAAKVLSVSGVVQWMAYEGFHPALWRVTATSWADAFGDAEPVARYLSTLLSILAFALVYRLGADLFDDQVGLIAVLLVGALPFYQFFGHELRPYPALAAAVAGMQLAFLRWLRHQDFRYALLFVVFGIAGIHIHYFAVYALLALAITLIVLVRWDRGVYARAAGLFVAIGLSFLPWTLAIAHGALVTNEGGINYSLSSDLHGLAILTSNLQGIPLFILTGSMIPVGLIYPCLAAGNGRAEAIFRADPEWRRWYVIVAPAAMLVLAFAANVFVRNLTPRNMMILLPSLAVAGAFQLRAFRWQARLVPVTLIGLMGLLVFHPYSPNIPYRQTVAFIAETIQDGDRIVTNINHHGAGATALTYALVDWLPEKLTKEDVFHVVEPGIRATFAVAPDPLPAGHIVQDDDPNTLAAFATFLGSAERVFLIRYYGPPLYTFTPLTEPFLAVLDDRYVPVRETVLDTSHPESVERSTYTVVEYRLASAALPDIPDSEP